MHGLARRNASQNSYSLWVFGLDFTKTVLKAGKRVSSISSTECPQLCLLRRSVTCACRHTCGFFNQAAGAQFGNEDPFDTGLEGAAVDRAAAMRRRHVGFRLGPVTLEDTLVRTAAKVMAARVKGRAQLLDRNVRCLFQKARDLSKSHICIGDSIAAFSRRWRRAPGLTSTTVAYFFRSWFMVPVFFETGLSSWVLRNGLGPSWSGRKS